MPGVDFTLMMSASCTTSRTCGGWGGGQRGREGGRKGGSEGSLGFLATTSLSTM